MSILYNLILLLLLLLYIPVFIYKKINGRYKKELGQRFGFLSKTIIDRFKGKPTIWVHAVSVGETVAASPIVTELKKLSPQSKILFSTVTDTGQEMAKKIVKEADGYIYFPLDLPWVVKRVLSLIKPDLIIIMETELWPNFIKTANNLGIRVMLANGRISDSSAKGYKYLGSIMKEMLAKIDLFAMQSEQDLKYILNLGAEVEKVFNLGNTKFDQKYAEINPEIKKGIYREFKLSKNQPILVVGSTHPNEEEQLIPGYKRLKAEFKDLVMILAPRHIERVKEIESLYQKAGITTICRTKIGDRRQEQAVILLDTIGELAQIYSIADLVFIGGSLVEKGGHNILEPAAQGKLVFFGPYMFNFKDNTNLLLTSEAAIQLNNVEELTQKMLFYLKNREELEVKGRKALKVIELNKGAAQRNARLAVELLEMKRKNNVR